MLHVVSTPQCDAYHAQVYYELAAEREKQGKQKEVAIVRMEQLAPFPYDLVMREIRRYPNAEVDPNSCPLPPSLAGTA